MRSIEMHFNPKYTPSIKLKIHHFHADRSLVENNNNTAIHTFEQIQHIENNEFN